MIFAEIRVRTGVGQMFDGRWVVVQDLNGERSVYFKEGEEGFASEEEAEEFALLLGEETRRMLLEISASSAFSAN